MVDVSLPAFVAQYTGGERSLKIDASSVEALMKVLVEKYGHDLEERFFEADGKLRRVLNVYVNGRNIRFTGDLKTPLKSDDKVSILAAVAGGDIDEFQ